MLSIGPMECLFSKRRAANLDLPLPYFEVPEVFLEPDSERSSGLTGVLLGYFKMFIISKSLTYAFVMASL